MPRTPGRIEKLTRTLVAEPAVDAILVLSVTNVRYLTGFSGSSAALFVAKERALLVSDGRYATQIAQECPGLEVHIRPVEQTLNQAIGEVGSKLGIRTLAFELAMLSVADFEDLEESLGT